VASAESGDGKLERHEYTLSSLNIEERKLALTNAVNSFCVEYLRKEVFKDDCLKVLHYFAPCTFEEFIDRTTLPVQWASIPKVCLASLKRINNSIVKFTKRHMYLSCGEILIIAWVRDNSLPWVSLAVSLSRQVVKKRSFYKAISQRLTNL
jgi:hypothetical protein